MELKDKEIEDLKAENESLSKRLDGLAGLESEVATLKSVNHRLRYSVYIPKKDDTVDRMLGGYINGRPEDDPLKIMFLRESEGVYRFGQKRVYIKAEKGGKIVVRVGGGFMGIEEFID